MAEDNVLDKTCCVEGISTETKARARNVENQKAQFRNRVHDQHVRLGDAEGFNECRRMEYLN